MNVAADPCRLASILERRASVLRMAGAAACCFDADLEIYGEFSGQAADPFQTTTRVSAACVAKLATATLALDAVSAGKLDLAEHLDVLLGRLYPHVRRGNFAGVTISHLIDHTHGIDGSDVREAYHDRHGHIDAPHLLMRLAARRRLHEPGHLYSYGHVGYIILGALLERVHGARFAELLDTQLLAGLGIRSEPPSLARRNVCPATAANLTVCVRDAAQLLKYYSAALDRAAQVAGAGWLHSVWDNWQPMPGWSSTDTGYAFGWRHQTNGWFNLSGRGKQSDVLILKWNPRMRRGLIVAGAGMRTLLLADQVTAELWGLTGQPAMTASGARPPVRAAETSAYAGVYEDCSSSLLVEEVAQGLRMTVSSRTADASGEPAQHTLHFGRPANGLAFRKGADPASFYFIHFLRDPRLGHPSHLWNGMRIWPRNG